MEPDRRDVIRKRITELEESLARARFWQRRIDRITLFVGITLVVLIAVRMLT